jgi:hypothetical protein
MQMPLKVQHVGRAITGGTGLASSRAILAGARAAGTRAPRRDYRGKHAAATRARALPGPWRAAPRVALAQAVAL